MNIYLEPLSLKQASLQPLLKLQEETKKRDRAAHATVLTTLMSLIVSYVNSVSDQDFQDKMISNIAPILLMLALALKTIIESGHDKSMLQKSLVGYFLLRHGGC